MQSAYILQTHDNRRLFDGNVLGEIPLLAGSYSYKFQCMLPTSLPTSFEGIGLWYKFEFSFLVTNLSRKIILFNRWLLQWKKGEFGYIRYYTRVMVDIPLMPDQIYEQPFTVINAVNLNDDPALRVCELRRLLFIKNFNFSSITDSLVQLFVHSQAPVIVEKRKTFSPFLLCCCKSSRPMTIIAKVPYGGYTPSQTINLECNVKNDSDQPASKFTIKLVKVWTFFGCDEEQFNEFYLNRF